MTNLIRMFTARLPLAVLALAALAGGLVGVMSGTAPVGHAAGMSVSSGRLSTFHPSGVPQVCTSQTLVATTDTWVNEFVPAQSNGASTTLNVTTRNGRNARTLVSFALPAAPAGCTLTGATLRLYNATPVAGRTIQAFRAAATWNNTVSWTSQPATAGTAVSTATPAAAAWMQWSVLAHVQAMYSGTNTGFVLRDSVEGGPTATQVFQSMDLTNKPELVLTWS